MKCRAAVKVAYDGRRFTGSQRQPDQRTVEGEIIRSLELIGAIDSPSSSRFKMASRTDRGVSALGNVVAFDTAFPREQLLQALNAQCDDVHAHGIAIVPHPFTPRRATSRWYRYLLPSSGADIELMMEAASLFQGKHDFTGFCRSDGRSPIKVIREVRAVSMGGFMVLDFIAREFLRSMVRRMVAAIESVGRGASTLEQVIGALQGRGVSFGLAPPNNLCLMDVGFNFTFETGCPETLLRKLRRGEEEAFLLLDFHRALIDKCLER